MALNLFGRFPNWLHDALGLQEPSVPTHLEDDVVIPTLDIGQGGWGNATWVVRQFNVAANSPAGTIVIAERDPLRQYLVFADGVAQAFAADQLVNYRLFDSVLNVAMHLKRHTLPSSGVIQGHAAIFGSLDPVVCPPGIQFEVTHPATGVGESFNFRVLLGTLRGGYKPI